MGLKAHWKGKLMDKLFEKVKTALRVSVTDAGLDAEINELIKSARADLTVNGKLTETESGSNESLVNQAIILYVKGHWGYDNPDAQRFLDSYDDLKNKLSLNSQYRKNGIEYDSNNIDESDSDDEGFIVI